MSQEVAIATAGKQQSNYEFGYFNEQVTSITRFNVSRDPVKLCFGLISHA